ncbi:DUF2637 domain-containing protein [Streptomyces sp. NPDC057428]|uniref:DUF2637 domain-containing protein n=1 Tax=Streptomyces sp. NPDC057428 TaxID=3346129 RepID=UPI0036A8A5AC
MTEERFTRRTVTAVMAVIAALAFVFSFGNVWALALRLGVPHPIAPLVAPMVDLSVVGLLVALRFLALHSVPEPEMRAGTRLLHLCGLLTLALNTAEPLLTGRYGRACLDTVAPLLLLGWGRVGPSILAQFHTLTQPPPLPKAATEPVRIPAAETVTDGAFAHTVPSPTHAPVTDPPRPLIQLPSPRPSKHWSPTPPRPRPPPRSPSPRQRRPPPARPCPPPCSTPPGASRTPTTPSTDSPSLPPNWEPAWASPSRWPPPHSPSSEPGPHRPHPPR